MSIGSRRTRIKVIGTTSVEDGIGGFITDKQTVKETWAQVKELTGNRAQQFRAVYNNQPIQMKVRTGSYDITTNNLIEYKGKECTIHSVTTDQQNRETELIVWVAQV